MTMEKERKYEVITVSLSGLISSRKHKTKSGAIDTYKGLVVTLRSFDKPTKELSDTAYVVYRETRVYQNGNEIVYEERKSYVL